MEHKELNNPHGQKGKQKPCPNVCTQAQPDVKRCIYNVSEPEGWVENYQAGGWRALETGKLCKLVGKLIFEQTSEESKEALASTS